MDNEPKPALTAPRRAIFIIAGMLILVAALALMLWQRNRHAAPSATKIEVESKHADEHQAGEGDEVKLSAEALKAAGIETVEVAAQSGGARLRVTGAIEANQQQMQQATPLVAGRIERVNVALGDRVRAGSVLAVIASPQIAQLHGKLHEAETKLALAEREFTRVLKAENRVGVLSAKAKLDEAETTLSRTRRLVELGAAAARELIAAETVYQTAKAEYDFQRNIALNREVQEADAAVQTARVDVAHIRDEMRALGAPLPGPNGEHEHGSRNNTALLSLLAPVTGTIIERKVNAGAGIEAGQALFTMANLSTIWVIANVPEAQVSSLSLGSPAVITAAPLRGQTLTGRISYIAPQLNEETRTARVRVEVSNPNECLKVGMFAEVEFQIAGAPATSPELVVPEEAIQRIGERTIVFVPTQEAGHFKARDVEIAATSNGFRRIKSGLQAGDRVVAKGSFALKTQLMKGSLGEEHH